MAIGDRAYRRRRGRTVKLTIDQYRVTSLEWGDKNAYKDGRLTISKEGINDYLAKIEALSDIVLTDMELICPGTSTRVINIFEVLPAHLRLGEGASNFPGVLDPIQAVGDGASAALSDFSILALSIMPSRYLKTLDKDGPGTLLTPYSSHHHLAFMAEPRQPGMNQSDYNVLVKKMGLALGTYLTRIAAATSAPADVAEYSLDTPPTGLPRVVYVCMLASLQNWDKGEPILYGSDLSNMIPTILHPNELLDGAVVAQNFNLGIDTYSFVNNPVVQSLYERHGKDVDFVGIVACGSHVTRNQRERSVQMICKLAKDILGADMAILTKTGGGIPESDVMMTVENLEKRGVTTVPIIWAHWGDGTIKDILTAYSPAADAMVSVGVNDAMFDLPGQKHVFGGDAIAPLSDDPGAAPMPAHEPIRLRYREFCGAINQLGASPIALLEI